MQGCVGIAGRLESRHLEDSSKVLAWVKTRAAGPWHGQGASSVHWARSSSSPDTCSKRVSLWVLEREGYAWAPLACASSLPASSYTAAPIFNTLTKSCSSPPILRYAAWLPPTDSAYHNPQSLEITTHYLLLLYAVSNTQ